MKSLNRKATASLALALTLTGAGTTMALAADEPGNHTPAATTRTATPAEGTDKPDPAPKPSEKPTEPKDPAPKPSEKPTEPKDPAPKPSEKPTQPAEPNPGVTTPVQPPRGSGGGAVSPTKPVPNRGGGSTYTPPRSHYTSKTGVGRLQPAPQRGTTSKPALAQTGVTSYTAPLASAALVFMALGAGTAAHAQLRGKGRHKTRA